MDDTKACFGVESDDVVWTARAQQIVNVSARLCTDGQNKYSSALQLLLNQTPLHGVHR